MLPSRALRGGGRSLLRETIHQAPELSVAHDALWSCTAQGASERNSSLKQGMAWSNIVLTVQQVDASGVCICTAQGASQGKASLKEKKQKD